MSVNGDKNYVILVITIFENVEYWGLVLLLKINHPIGIKMYLRLLLTIQFNANHLNESRARIELYKLYTGIKLYIQGVPK